MEACEEWDDEYGRGVRECEGGGREGGMKGEAEEKLTLNLSYYIYTSIYSIATNMLSVSINSILPLWQINK